MDRLGVATRPQGTLMPAPYSVKAIANAILEKSFRERQPITPLKLQKLLYYAHGYYSGAYGSPLIDEAFEAWQYGPVAPSIYHEFKEFGNEPITRLARELDWDLEGEVPVPAVHEPRVDKVVDYVWKTYAGLSGLALSEMTHRENSPWDKTMKSNKFKIRNMDIPQEAIIEYFAPLIKKKTP